MAIWSRRSPSSSTCVKQSLLPIVFSSLLCGAGVLCQAQMVERCNLEHIATERYKLPLTPPADHAATQGVIARLDQSSGWTLENVTSGIVIQGNLTLLDGSTIPITIFHKGRGRLRVEETFPAGKRIIVSSGSMAYISMNGKIKDTYPDSVREELSFLPFFSDLGMYSAGIRYTAASSVEKDGRTLQTFRSVHITLDPNASNAPGIPPAEFLYRLNRRPTESDFFLDPATLLPVEVRSCSPIPANSNASNEVVRTFSNYTTTDGFAYPTLIQRTLGGGKPITLTITSLQINQKLDDSLWALQAANGGAK
jgi:hypothetical protein